MGYSLYLWREKYYSIQNDCVHDHHGDDLRCENGGDSVSVKLILDDCLTKMQSFEKESIDLIFTSPPYNLGEPVKGSMFVENRGEKLAYNKYNDTLPEHEYIRWQHDILKTCYSLIKDTGAIFYNHKPCIKNKIYDDRRNLIPFNIRQEIIWDTISFFNFNGWFFVPHTERIFIIAKDNWKPSREFVSCGEIWKFPPTPSKKHPATFPLQLAKRVVLSASNEGDTILDPFMGIGTVGIACAQTGRDFIGIEIDEKYFSIAEKNINDAKKQPKLI